MDVKQFTLHNDLDANSINSIKSDTDLILLFISPKFKSAQGLVNALKKHCPSATVVGCSTAGEINDINVYDNSVSISAISFNSTKIKKEAVRLETMETSEVAGIQIASKLKSEDLKHVLVFSDGLNVNGADLVSGLKKELPNVSITGGLAADGSDFNKTFIINDDEITDKTIVAIGFYGDDLKVGFSSKGGWDSFGIDRKVTKSNKNVLYELDGEPALKLYKSFLGDEAENLPSSGLLFPLSMRDNESSLPVVRTILSINEEEQSLTFAGNLPEGSFVRLMKANVDRLINGAEQSAEIATNAINSSPSLSILISCVGRRLVLNQLVEEEVEAVREVVGEKSCITGFYSYGEIAPFGEFSPCELHNQTMTITTLAE